MSSLPIILVGWLITAALPSAASALVSLELIAKTELPSDLRFQKTRVGGLSGLVFDPEKKLWIAMSDDRGRINEPRFYDLDLTLKKTAQGFDLKATPKAVHLIRQEKGRRWDKGVLDAEGITILPWGNYLISNEGDNNQKPRSMPNLLDVKPDGTWVRNFDLPDECLPEAAGPQHKGIQNNQGPEGLTSSDDGHFIWTAIEGQLVQESKPHQGQIRIYQYEMSEAWVIKPMADFYYPMEPLSEGSIVGQRGVSEIFWLKGKDLLVMERELAAGLQGLKYSVQLFQVTLGEPAHVLKKELVVDFKKLDGKVTNFEALAKGPVLPDGRKTLVVMSDNNFQKGEPTVFWLFALGSE